MKAVLQRVKRGSVTVSGERIAEISQGLVILIGIGPADTQQQAEKLAQKIAQMRIFQDKNGKMNLSVLDIGGSALVVPQFTLYADTSKGHRPAFTKAAPPDIARPLSDYFADCLEELGVPTQRGKFGAYMQVEIHNDGPVTIVVENKKP
jgi:D-tyrosyl-tRNA(Tyr) deacylase